MNHRGLRFLPHTSLLVALAGVLGFCFSTVSGALAGDPGSAQVSATANEAKPSKTGMLVEELRWLQAEKITVSTASLRSETVEQAPATVRVITARQIRERGYQSLHEILRDLPGVAVLDHVQAESKNRIAFRGITGNNKFIILKDGIRINSPTGEPITPVAENFALYDVKQVEVLYGPASALYGADAFTGVINLVTRDIPDEWAVDGDVAGGEFDTYRLNLRLARRVNDWFAFSLGGHYFETDFADLTRKYPGDFPLNDQVTFGGVVVTPAAARLPYAGDYSAWGTTAKVEVGPHLTLGWNQSLFRAHMSEGDRNEITEYGTGNYNNTLLATPHAKWHQQFNERWTLDAQANYSRYEQLPESKFVNIFSGYGDAYKYGLGERIQFEPRVTLELERHTFIGGLTYENFHSIPHTQDLSTPYDTDKDPNQQGQTHPGSAGTLPIQFFTASYWNLGSFLQAQSEWTDQITTTAGVRFDYNEDYKETINPRAGVVYRPRDDTTVKALYGRSFLAPAQFLRFENFGSFGALGSPTTSFFFRIPNPDLKPEKLQTGELSLTHNLTPDLTASLVGFYTDAKDIILPGAASAADLAAFIPGTVIFAGDQEQNIGDAEAYGAEVTLDYTIRQSRARWDLWGSFTYVDGTLRDKSTGGRFALPFTSREMVKLGVTFNFKDRVVITPSFYWNGEQTGAPPFAPRTSSHGILNLYVEVRTKNQLGAAFIRVTNLTDERYFNAGAGGPFTAAASPQDPRWIQGGVRLQF
jgi:outer membrane receptor protein involved in Fe transport